MDWMKGFVKLMEVSEVNGLCTAKTVVAAARYSWTDWQRVELAGRGRSVREGEVQFPWSEVLAEASCAFPPNRVR